VTSWYDRVTDLLGEPGSDVADLDPALTPEDVDLLLRAATDLMPPADAHALADRWAPDLGDIAHGSGDADGSTLSWTSLVEQAQPWAPADADTDLGAPLALGDLGDLAHLGGLGDPAGLASATDELAVDFPHPDLDLEFGTGAPAYDDDGDPPSWPGDGDDRDDGDDGDDGGLGAFGAGLHQLDLPDGGELEHHLGGDGGFDDDAPVDDEDPDDGSSVWDDPPAHHHDY
jgi:hypothetical protein